MDTITKNRTLVSIIIFLLISNIAILTYFLAFNHSRKGSHGKESRNTVATFLQNDINFSKQQMDEYQNLRNTHMVSVKPIFNDIRSAKERFYNLLYINNVPDSSVKIASAAIGEKQIILDMHMFTHFKEVRNLSTPQQLPKFDSLFKKVVDKMTGNRFKKSDSTKKD